MFILFYSATIYLKFCFVFLISYMKKVIFAIIICTQLYSCEKNITFKLNNVESLLVVDANIENGQRPQVVLTKSFDYFSNIDASLLSNSFVHGSVVSVSDGIITQQLKEYVYSFGNFNLYYYSTDSTNSFKGKVNTNYTLNINSNNKNYLATTTIPSVAKKIDTIFWKIAPYAKDSNDVILFIRSTDPPGLGNYIRYFTKKDQLPFLPGRNSVFDDQIIDGTSYQLQVEPGIDRNKDNKTDSNYFKKGDIVTLKLCNIDKATFTFWSTWEFAFNSIGNPFSQPNKVIGNISNGALGSFYGYGADYKTIKIPK